MEVHERIKYRWLHSLFMLSEILKFVVVDRNTTVQLWPQDEQNHVDANAGD